MTGSQFAVPTVRPYNSSFSSGPCSKRPGWCFELLSDASLGRSHRATHSKSKLKQVIELTKDILNIPVDYRVAIVPASDTGSVEMALWSLLGPCSVTVMVWESFGAIWLNDVVNQLGLKPIALTADYGFLPDLTSINFDHDLVFTWNGTTSGVRLPDGNFISSERKGLTICDATSAVFAQRLPFNKLDVVTFSWQKALGGEAAHGMLILSPRAVDRLETYTPPWPLPKIFRLTRQGKLIDSIFEGETINTPSMLCVEDYLDSLNWAKRIGGFKGLHSRANENLSILTQWVDRTDWIDFLAKDTSIRSNTSVCLSIIDPDFVLLCERKQRAFVKNLTGLLEDRGVAYDISGYRDAPPGLRIWTGPTVDHFNLEALLPWLDWAFETTKYAY
ncbi:phosphoserine transaminase [Candidatus Endowatersipora endosymbiont of Watersipora subatra]|uniref:phosphoserine transaminase n=1 Tax=Candidatus Endowatersipora endosymbiont of Watersipora subatra TaxID=3077946 RepID=UPI00312C8585